MSIEIGFLFAVLAVMVYLFLTERLPIDLTAFLGLVIILFAGFIEPHEAFTGFSSTAVITMLSIFILSGALDQTGLADMVGRRVHAMVGAREVPLIITIMLAAGLLSAFANNIAATAVLLPAVASIAHRSGLSPSRFFMPLSFGAILGGTTTMVGTPPNILAAEMLRDRGLQPFSLFSFTPLGLIILALGVVFMITVGRRLLPDVSTRPAPAGGGDLAKVYQLHERLFSIQIPGGSRLDGIALGQSRIGHTLNVQVVAILRKGHKIVAPGGGHILREGDTLLVEGKLKDMKELVRIKGVTVHKTKLEDLPRPTSGVSGIRLRVNSGSSLIGKTLVSSRFRDRFGIQIAGIQRGDEVMEGLIGGISIEEGDRLLGLGTRSKLEELKGSEEFEVRALGLSAVQQLQEQLYAIRVPKDSPLVGTRVGSSHFTDVAGLMIGGLIRGHETMLAVSPDEIIREDDRLLITGEPSHVVELLKLGEVELKSETEEPVIETDEVGIVEVALAPRSPLLGKTLSELEFREQFGLQVLAIWRRGRPYRTQLGKMPLEFGDALLLQGPWDRIRRMASDPDIVVLTQNAVRPKRTKKAPFALGALALMIAMVVSGFQPIHVAAFTAATLAVLFGAIRMDEAYRAVEWRAVFLVAALLPVGIAMERTGAAMYLAGGVSAAAGPFGPYAILASLVLLSSVLSQALDGAPAVVLLTPVALQISEQMGLSPYPIMMGIGLAASAAFMTPFSHKANLLVMGAGGYRAMDYIRVGTPLTIILLAMLVFLVPVFFPF
jgi:di/tricarboxylate transporter